MNYKKGRIRIITIVVLLIGIIAIIATSCGGDDVKSKISNAETVKYETDLTYEIDGENYGLIALINDEENKELIKDIFANARWETDKEMDKKLYDLSEKDKVIENGLREFDWKPNNLD